MIAEGDTETSSQGPPVCLGTAELNRPAFPDKRVAGQPAVGTIPPGGRTSDPAGPAQRADRARSEVSHPARPDPAAGDAGDGAPRITPLISVFAEPATRVAPQLQWRIDSTGGPSSLVAVNSGRRHDTIRGIKLYTAEGAAALDVEAQHRRTSCRARRRRRILGMTATDARYNRAACGERRRRGIDQAVRVDARDDRFGIAVLRLVVEPLSAPGSHGHARAGVGLAAARSDCQ